MSFMLSLKTDTRDIKKDLTAIRTEGLMPAVFYGPKQPSTPISVTMTEFKKVWKKAGESSVIILKNSDGSEHEVLIHDVDIHPVSGYPRHADFYVLEKGKKVKVSVPLNFIGVSPAVKEKAGILVKVLREIELEAEPKNLPHDITVDISSLIELSDIIQAKNLTLPAGVELKINPEDVVASIAIAKEEVEEVPTTIDMSAIEVEAKGKEIKEGEDAPTETKDKNEGQNKTEDKKQEKKS